MGSEMSYERAMVVAHTAHERKRTSGARFFHEEGGHFCDMMAAAAQEGYQQAADRITALEAMCEKMAGALEHARDDFHLISRDSQISSRLFRDAKLARDKVQETLAQYREADND